MMREVDDDKTAFITPYGAYCYTSMTFGLKNEGATYQRMMQNCLTKQIRCNVRVYVDDMVVKTRKENTLLDDLHETFANLKRYQIKLNPKKCVFWVPAGQLLGYLVSARGIEPHPEKNSGYPDHTTPNQASGYSKISRPSRNTLSIHQQAG